MNRVGVEPKVLRWARERSGRGHHYLQKRFPKLDAWERGSVLPTLKQLEEFSRATYVPLGYLFLKEPPSEELPISDLRTIGDLESRRPSPDLLDTLYLCQRRQDWYREEASASGKLPLEFVGSLDSSADITFAGARLRDDLGFDVEKRQGLATWSEALRQFKVSTLAVLRQIHDLDGLSREEFQSAYQEELGRLQAFRTGRGGGNAIKNVGPRVSKRLARALVVSTLESRTSYTGSFRLLGVWKLSTFESVAVSLGVEVAYLLDAGERPRRPCSPLRPAVACLEGTTAGAV